MPYPERTGTRVPAFISVIALIILAMLSVVSYTIVDRIHATEGYRRNADDLKRSRREMRALANEIVTALEQDANTGNVQPSDHRSDSVWTRTGERSGYTIVLRDVSSGLNPNWMNRRHFVQVSESGRVLRPGINEHDIQEVRERVGFTLDVQEEFGALFDPDLARLVITPYSNLSVAIGDDDALIGMLELQGVRSSRVPILLREIQSQRDRPEPFSETALARILGDEADNLMPWITVDAPINVNLADESVIRFVLSLPFGGAFLPAPRSITEHIVQTRRDEPITSSVLAGLIGADTDQQDVFAYLGTVTRFWEIEVIANSLAYSIVVMRMSGEEPVTSEGIEYRRVDETWSSIP